MKKVITSSLLTALSQQKFSFEYIQNKRNADRKVFRFMRGFFYSSNKGVEILKANVNEFIIEQFPDAVNDGTIQIIDQGSQWTPFNGGASVQHQSHYWVDVSFPKDFKIEV